MAEDFGEDVAPLLEHASYLLRGPPAGICEQVGEAVDAHHCVELFWAKRQLYHITLYQF